MLGSDSFQRSSITYISSSIFFFLDALHDSQVKMNWMIWYWLFVHPLSSSLRNKAEFLHFVLIGCSSRTDGRNSLCLWHHKHPRIKKNGLKQSSLKPERLAHKEYLSTCWHQKCENLAMCNMSIHHCNSMHMAGLKKWKSIIDLL